MHLLNYADSFLAYSERGAAHERCDGARVNHLKSGENGMSLSTDDIHRIAKLGCLDISDEQAVVMQGELNRIFNMIEQIAGVGTEGVAPMPNPHDATQRLRPDAVTESDRRVENMKNAPEQSQGCFLVPQVIE